MANEGPDVSAAVASIDAALERRRALFAGLEIDVYRAFHGWTEGVPRLEIDRYAKTMLISARETTDALADHVARFLAERNECDTVVVRTRGAEPRTVVGESPGSIIVHEDGLRFAVQPLRPRNPGLYIDARPARRWIASNSDGRRVLNLFAFTGSLGLAASVGAARSVVHVDQQASALQRTRENYRLNQLSIDDRDLVRLNIYQHLRRNAAKRLHYDAVIVDSPPYAPHKDRTPGGRGIFAVAKLARPMLRSGGWMLCFFHGVRQPRARVEAELIEACGGGLEILWQGTSGEDYPEPDEWNKTRMTAFQVVT